MNPFAEHYKTLSNAGLLDIIDHQNDYQALAIEAANEELNRRELSDEQINEAKQENETIRLETEARNKHINQITHTAESLVTSFIDSINPFASNKALVDKIINIFCLALVLMNGYAIYRQLRFIFESFGYMHGKLLLYYVVDPTPILCLLTGIYLMWQRHKTGWYLLFAYFCYRVGCIIYFLSRELTYAYAEQHAMQYLTPMIIGGLILSVLLRRDIRLVYKITHLNALAAMLFGVSFILIQYLIIIAK